ncbi:MAG: magnesium transporter CorA family protein [Acidimicrobiales bacterium]
MTIHDMDQLDTMLEAGQLMWLDVITTDPDELDALGERFSFDPGAIEDILDVEQLPKFEDYDDHVFVVIHGLSSDGDRVDTREVDCFIGQNLFVTVHAEPVVGIDWLWDAVQRHEHLAGDSADELFGQLAEVVGRRYIEIANEIESRIDRLAEAALDADPSVLQEVQTLRREEATVRKMLRPQLLVIRDLRKRNMNEIGKEAARLLGDAYDVHRQVVESLSATRGLLTDTLDTYRGASADQQARATTLLAVYSALLLPLTLITGWYGMNVRGLPAAERQHSWWIVTLIMLAIALVSAIVFVQIGLIRLPGTRQGRVTAGLAAAAKAPVKPFTMLRKPVTSGSKTIVASARRATGRASLRRPSS